jgi:uncharacterized protein (TIGR01777 family)
MRVAVVRTGIVLGLHGGALKPLIPVFKLGLGGRVASGKQWTSWIHIDDQVGIYTMAIDEAEGALNATAPEPVRNADFTNALAAALHRPAFLVTPAFALKLVFGEGAPIMTEGQKVLPVRTREVGYTFKYPHINAAMQSAVVAALPCHRNNLAHTEQARTRSPSGTIRPGQVGWIRHGFGGVAPRRKCDRADCA